MIATKPYDLTQDMLNRWKGTVCSRVLDRPKAGRKYGRPISPWTTYPNGAKTVGINKILDTSLRAQTQVAQWYVGLIDNVGFISDTDPAETSASHPNWAELTTYTSGTRLAWSPSAASAGVLTIAAAITFTTNADSVIRGILVASSSTKNSAVDVLLATATDASGRSILSGQQYQVFYSVEITPS